MVSANMFQLYTYDFTDQWAGLERGELSEDGLFPAYPHLDAYWSEPDRTPYLIRADGHLAGVRAHQRLEPLRPACLITPWRSSSWSASIVEVAWDGPQRCRR